MTVEQLMAILQKMPPEKTVRIGTCDPMNGSVVYNIDEVLQEPSSVYLWRIYQRKENLYERSHSME